MALMWDALQPCSSSAEVNVFNHSEVTTTETTVGSPSSTVCINFPLHHLRFRLHSESFCDQPTVSEMWRQISNFPKQTGSVFPLNPGSRPLSTKDGSQTD